MLVHTIVVGLPSSAFICYYGLCMMFSLLPGIDAGKTCLFPHTEMKRAGVAKIDKIYSSVQKTRISSHQNVFPAPHRLWYRTCPANRHHKTRRNRFLRASEVFLELFTYQHAPM